MRSSWFIVFLFLNVFSYAKTIYIVPWGSPNGHKCFFSSYHCRDEVSKWCYTLRETLIQKGYQVKFTLDAKNISDASAVLSFNVANDQFLRNLEKIDRKKCFLFIFEPAVVMPKLYDPKLTKNFCKIFVMLDNVVDNKNYFKFYFPQPRTSVIPFQESFESKKLCTLISIGNKTSSHPDELYSARREIVAFFTKKHPDDFDVFGAGWGNASKIIPSKWDVIKKYKFCFCYENMGNQKGYITEKLFDTMISGSVPIYLGADNITDFIPATCFIDRRHFSSLENLYTYIKKMDRHTYETYRKAIEDYFKAPQSHLFSIKYFLQIVTEALEELERSE